MFSKRNSRSVKSLDNYFHEIGDYLLITPEEEARLAKKIRAGDERAFQKLIESNLRFVVTVAIQYMNRGLPLEDLINEGNIGLMKAAKRFDETRGFKFISYAVWWIRQQILSALAEKARLIRLPKHQVNRLSKISIFHKAFEQKNEREPNLSDLAKLLNITDEDLTGLFNAAARHLPLNATANNREEQNLLDAIENKNIPPPDTNLLQDDLKLELMHILNTLTRREAEILKLFFGLDNTPPLSLQEIADRFNLNRERVRQIKEKSLIRLRHSSRSRRLRSFLG